MKSARELTRTSLLAGLLFAPSAAFGDTSAPSSPPVQQPSLENRDENTVICKLTPAVTGTRLGGGRECRTKLEWKQRELDAQQTVRHIQRIGLDDRAFAKGGGP